MNFHPPHSVTFIAGSECVYVDSPGGARKKVYSIQLEPKRRRKPKHKPLKFPPGTFTLFDF